MIVTIPFLSVLCIIFLIISINISDIQMPERPKLHYIERVPNYTNSNIRPPKMHKRLGLMRGPELVHNKLIHKQYGIQVKLNNNLF